MTTIRRALLPKQMQFMRADAAEVMFSGAFGAGKTRVLCEKTLELAVNHPGNRVGLFRQTAVALRATTLRTLLDGDGRLPPVIPPAYIAGHHKTDRVITLRNGSEIVYGGLKSSEGGLIWLNSLNLGAALVDQAEEITLDDWLLLGGRLRLDVPGLERRRIYGACNPRDPGHWIYQRFLRASSRQRLNTQVIKTRSRDNWHLPADYLARIEAFTGPFYDRFVLGKWVGLEGLVYDNFAPEVHIIEPFPLSREWRRWRSIDFGYTNPFTCLWACEVGADNAGGLPEGSIVIYREIYMSRRRVAEHAQHINAISEGERYETTYADHDAGDRAELDAHGITTLPADKAVSMGIQTTRGWLGNERGALPRLYFFGDALVEMDISLIIDPRTGDKKHAPTCTSDEFLFYRWQTGAGGVVKEQPVKTHDHGMDALRYLLYSMAQIGEQTVAEGAVSVSAGQVRERFGW